MGDGQTVEILYLEAYCRPGSTDPGEIEMTAASFRAAVAVPRA